MSAPIGVPASGPAATSQIVTERLALRPCERHDCIRVPARTFGGYHRRVSAP